MASIKIKTLPLLSVLIILFFLLSAGCTSAPKNEVVFKNSPPFILGSTIPLRAGVTKFRDNRVQDANKSAAELGSVEEMITKKFIGDLNRCEVFTETSPYNGSDQVDIILKGNINHFEMRCHKATGEKIVLAIGGGLIGAMIADSAKWAWVSARCSIEIDLYNAKTGKIVGTYEQDKSFERREIYLTCDGSALNMVLHQASGDLIRDLFSDRAKILSSVAAKP
ncbi:MAG: hypothetical protein JRI76_14050 [Deltaproteobacteria bacterium]|nr:hypothetical protein [Deltaproteobacteria bacterium]MBW2043128.1 hypothetical protein [Deltaproteobacteria bacterium]MBW2133126.1 hypothetical protein [Deltaproteobacteria bacterium]